MPTGAGVGRRRVVREGRGPCEGMGWAQLISLKLSSQLQEVSGCLRRFVKIKQMKVEMERK